jgi:hypothetical protein
MENRKFSAILSYPEFNKKSIYAKNYMNVKIILCSKYGLTEWNSAPIEPIPDRLYPKYDL